MARLRLVSLAAALIAASLAMVSPVYAVAGSISSATIINIRVYNSSTTPSVVVQFNATTSNNLACSPAPFNQTMAIDGSTAKGKLIASNAMAAFLSGRKVTVIGTGACLSGTTAEAIDSFTVAQ
jgi:hypothetical protein